MQKDIKMYGLKEKEETRMWDGKFHKQDNGEIIRIPKKNRESDKVREEKRMMKKVKKKLNKTKKRKK